jgi:hypothetical protein
MSGEQVGTTSGLIITSGKLEIWPLEAPENQGLRKDAKIPKGWKRPWQEYIYIAYARRQDAAKYVGKGFLSSLAIMNTVD